MKYVCIFLAILFSVDAFAPTERDELILKPPHCGMRYTTFIYKGEDAEPGEFPWVVLIEFEKRNGRCGGSLINKMWVVTAAHCVNERDYSFSIRLGELNLTDDPDYVDNVALPSIIRKEVKAIFVHEDYNIVTKANDIALLLLESPLANFSNYVKPICLPFNELYQEDNLLDVIVTICGWGLYQDNPEELAITLKKADITVWDLQRCRNKYSKARKNKKINDQHLCAFGEENQDTAKGDSGGPLMFSTVYPTEGQKLPFTYLAGITSFGRRRTDKDINKPAVYTRVGMHMDWIEKILVENS